MRALAFAAALVAAHGIAACGGDEPVFRGVPLVTPVPAPDFVLVDHQGQPASLRDQRGHVSLVFFGFTSCATVCPAALRTVDAALSTVDGAEDVRVLLVTVDPETDTPARLAAFVDPFRAEVIGLTGAPSVLAQVRAAYGALAARTDGPKATHLTHTASIYGVDRSGTLRVVMGGTDAAAIAADVTTLLAIGDGEAP